MRASIESSELIDFIVNSLWKYTIGLPNFIINRKMSLAAIIFEYDDKEYPELGEELVRRVPKFKDLMINHLSSLTLIELTEPDAKLKIRKDLLRLVNGTLPMKKGVVRDILFTSYIIQ